MGVLAIANACGVEYGLALDYLYANRLYVRLTEAFPAGVGRYRREWKRIEDAYAAIVKATSQETAVALQERLEAACVSGDIYWPYPGWQAAHAANPFDRPMYDKIEEPDDGVEPPYDPAALAAVADMRVAP